MSLRVTLVIILAIALGAAVVGRSVLADTPDKYGIAAAANGTGLNPTVAGQSSVEGVIGQVITIGLSLLGIVFFLLTLYAGIIWMIARGNEEEAKKAKDILEAAVIGLIIVLGSYAISKFVFNSLASGVGGGGQAAAPANTSCANSTDGTPCASAGGSAGYICVAKQCVQPCADAFKSQNGTCIDTSQGQTCVSPRVTEAGLCPGATTICCHDP